MRESIGSVFLYNVIIVFVFLVFAFLAGTLSYAKAFRVNSRIAKALEIYEGYNSLSDELIFNSLVTLGYNPRKTGECPVKDGAKATNITGKSSIYDYCIYRYTVDNRHFTYGITTYINLELPLIERIKLPIYSRTERIFKFSSP